MAEAESPARADEPIACSRVQAIFSKARFNVGAANPRLSEAGLQMKEELQARLDDLKKEFEIGQKRLRELEAEQSAVRETMLRISGAIQVLQELIDDANKDGRADGQPLEAGAAS